MALLNVLSRDLAEECSDTAACELWHLGHNKSEREHYLSEF